MRTKRKTGLSLAVGVLGSMTFGFLMKKYISSNDRASVMDKLKSMEHNVYMDGKKRADILEGIKKELDEKE